MHQLFEILISEQRQMADYSLKKSLRFDFVSSNLRNIWNPYRISAFITQNNYFHKIFRYCVLTIYCYGKFHILGFNSSRWVFYIFGPYCLFHISNCDIMGSKFISIEPYKHRFLLVPCDIYRCNTFYYREFI